MPIKVRCPSCKKVLTAPDAARGKAVRCSGCQGVVKIPAGAPEGSVPAKKQSQVKSEGLQESTEFLLNLRAKDAVDKNSNVCPKCGADMEEDQTECSVCGIDITTGEMGRKAMRTQKKNLEASDFSKFVWSDAKRFVGKNKNLMFQTMGTTVLRLVMTICAFLVYLWCYRLPPKTLAGFVTLVSLVSILGWPWYLYLKVLEAALDKKDRLKRVSGDYFATVALGVKFIAWCVAFGLPMVLLGFVMMWVFSASGQALVGTFITIACVVIIYLPFPIAMAHMAMPVQSGAWMIPKMFPLFFRLWKPTLYWWLVVITVNLPLIAGLAVVGAMYGPEAATMVEGLETQNDTWREYFNKSEEQGGEDVKAPEPVQWPSLTPMIVPVVILVVCGIYWGFSGVFSIRALALYVVSMKKMLDLTTDAPEMVFKPKSKSPTRKVRPVPNPKLNGILVLMTFAIYPVLGAYAALLYIEAENPIIPLAIGGVIGLVILLCIAGKWVAFQKFGYPGWTSAIPILNAATILKMAGWDGQYTLAFVFFPWIRKAVMNDVADRWGMDRQSFGLGLTFFPFAYWPMLGWNRQLHSDCFVPKEWDPTGKSKKRARDEDEE